MKIAVTGATGFVGRYVVPALLARGASVVAAARDPGRMYTESDRLTLAPMDMKNPEEAASALGEPDVLLHLAWGGLPNYRSDSHLLVELPQQIAFLQACRQAGLSRVVVAGTCLEYGMQAGQLDEEMSAAPATAYAQAKHQLHGFLQSEPCFAGTQLTWLRLFYLFGKGQASTSLYAQIRSAVDSGASSLAMSPGDQIRDFLPVERAAAIACALVFREHGLGTVNVCSGVPVEVASVARNWLDEMGSGLRLELGVLPYPDYEPFAFWGSRHKLDALLGTI